jgi:NTE family protein
VAGVPVNIAKQMEGDLTIAVNVGFDHTQHKIGNIFDVLSKVQDIMGNRLDGFQMKLADLAIVPQLGNIGTMHFHRAKECIDIGRAAAETALPQIREWIEGFKAKSGNEDLVG